MLAPKAWKDRPKQRFFTEEIGMLAETIGLREGFRAAFKVIQHGITPDKASKLEFYPKAWTGKTGAFSIGILNNIDLSLKRRVITNANELIQKESAYFDGTDAAEGFEFINGTMQINIDKAGDLVIETI